MIGTWYDKEDKYSYFGAFQFRVVDSKLLVGRFLGHSKKNNDIQHDIWEWKR